MRVPDGVVLTLAEQMRRHAGRADHLYGHLMRAMADDWDSGGPTRAVLAGWEDAPPGWVVQLRVLGGLFRIVLTDRAPGLVRYYPCLGGTADPATAWPAVREVFTEHVDELRAAVLIAPQTNEVGRANALLAGLFRAVERTELHRVRLLEPGSSAGLNLLVDEFRFVNDGWEHGPPTSPVQLVDGIEGPARPAPFTVVDRRGCDLAPVDATTEDGRLRLRSFVWPFHVERHRRLTGAFEIARTTPPVVDRASAADWLEARLREPAGPDTLTVVWQSITQQYWPSDETARVDEVVAAAAATRPLARVSMEYPADDVAAGAQLTVLWSPGDGGAPRREHLGSVGDHGVPVRLTPPRRPPGRAAG